jgi:hypothetical protein
MVRVMLPVTDPSTNSVPLTLPKFPITVFTGIPETVRLMD